MHVYDILKRPVITEKTMASIDEDKKYAFEVDLRANKHQVKEAVEVAFDVTVLDVNMMVMPAKSIRRGRRVTIRKPKWKKAIVTLAASDRIQLFEGV